jgi:hypothetical protein
VKSPDFESVLVPLVTAFAIGASIDYAVVVWRSHPHADKDGHHYSEPDVDAIHKTHAAAVSLAYIIT